MSSVGFKKRRDSLVPCDMRGFNLIELVVAMSLAAILTGIAIPRWNAQRMQIQTAHRQTIAALRLARTNAITKSIHYQVQFIDTTHIQVSRMMESPVGSGTWVVDSTDVKTQVLPNKTSFSSGAVPNRVEFNSRGLTVTNTLPTPTGALAPQVTVQDTFNRTRSVQVWPSGQIDAS